MTDVQPNPGHDPEDDYEDDELDVEGDKVISDGEEEDAAPDEAG